MNKKAQTITAVLLSLCLLWPQTMWAFESMTYASGLLTTPSFYLKGKKLALPDKWGSIASSHAAGAKTIVLIQDLHCNEEVQHHIAAIISHLAQHYGLSLVGEEGAHGKVDVSVLRTFPIPQIRQSVSDYFLSQGKLTGAEYGAANGARPVDLVGLENAGEYQQSLKLARGLLNAESQGYCQDLRGMLDQLKAATYNPELSVFDRLRSAYQEGRLDLTTYARQLGQWASRLGQSMAPYSELNQYLASGARFQPVPSDLDQLFAELDRLENALRQKLYTSEKQRTLDHWLDRLDLIEKMLNLSATQEELQRYRQHRDQYQIPAFIEFIHQAGGPKDTMSFAGDLQGLEGYLKKAETFYHLADRRSRSFAANVIHAMNARHQDLAVVITGGFHAKALLEELERLGLSYISVKPRLTKLGQVNPYFSILQGKQLPIEKLLAKNQTMLAPPSWPQAGRGFTKSVQVACGVPADAVLPSVPLSLKHEVAHWLAQHQEGLKFISPLTGTEFEERTKTGLPEGCMAYSVTTGSGSELLVMVAQKGMALPSLGETQFEVRAGSNFGEMQVTIYGSPQSVKQALAQVKRPASFLGSLTKAFQEQWPAMVKAGLLVVPGLAWAAGKESGLSGWAHSLSSWIIPGGLGLVIILGLYLVYHFGTQVKSRKFGASPAANTPALKLKYHIGILGASGTAASQLSRRLGETDDVGIVALTQRHPDKVKKMRIGLLTPNLKDRITLIERNLLTEPEAIKELVKKSNLVFNLAAITVSRDFSPAQKNELLLLNAIIPYLLARECQRQNKPLIIPSTIGVYNEFYDGPLDGEQQKNAQAGFPLAVSNEVARWLENAKAAIDEKIKQHQPALTADNYRPLLDAIQRQLETLPWPKNEKGKQADVYLASKLLMEYLLLQMAPASSTSSGFRVHMVRFETEYGPGATVDAGQLLGINKRIPKQLLALAKPDEYPAWNTPEGVPKEIKNQSGQAAGKTEGRAFVYGADIQKVLYQLADAVLHGRDQTIPVIFNFSPLSLVHTFNTLTLEMSRAAAAHSHLSLDKYLVRYFDDPQGIVDALGSQTPNTKIYNNRDDDPVLTGLLGRNWAEQLTPLKKGLPLFLNWLLAPSETQWHANSNQQPRQFSESSTRENLAQVKSEFGLSDEAMEALLYGWSLPQRDHEGWKKNGLFEKNGETVAGHTWGMGLLYLLLEQNSQAEDFYKLIVHDDPEVLMGDPTPHDQLEKEQKRRVEAVVLARLFAPFPNLLAKLMPKEGRHSGKPEKTKLAFWQNLAYAMESIKGYDVLDVYLEHRFYMNKYPEKDHSEHQTFAEITLPQNGMDRFLGLLDSDPQMAAILKLFEAKERPDGKPSLADETWRLSYLALLLAPSDLDLFRLVKMAWAGRLTAMFPERMQDEASIRKILAPFPQANVNALVALRQEYEAQETRESRFLRKLEGLNIFLPQWLAHYHIEIPSSDVVNHLSFILTGKPRENRQASRGDQGVMDRLRELYVKMDGSDDRQIKIFEKDVSPEVLRTQLGEVLEQNRTYEEMEKVYPGYTLAGLTMVIKRINGKYHLLFCRRGSGANQWTGYFTFPGGRQEKDGSGETPGDTSLRELEEEVGLRVEKHQGYLPVFTDEVNKVASSCVIVVLDNDQEPALQPNHELDKFVWIPIDTIMEKNGGEIQDRLIAACEDGEGRQLFTGIRENGLAIFKDVTQGVFSAKGTSRLWFTLHNALRRTRHRAVLTWEEYQAAAHWIENHYIWGLVGTILGLTAIAGSVWGVVTGDYSVLLSMGNQLTGFENLGWVKTISLGSWLVFFAGSHLNIKWLQAMLGKLFNKGEPIEDTPSENVMAALEIFGLLVLAHLAPLWVTVPLSYSVHRIINREFIRHIPEVPKPGLVSSLPETGWLRGTAPDRVAHLDRVDHNLDAALELDAAHFSNALPNATAAEKAEYDRLALKLIHEFLKATLKHPPKELTSLTVEQYFHAANYWGKVFVWAQRLHDTGFLTDTKPLGHESRGAAFSDEFLKGKVSPEMREGIVRLVGSHTVVGMVRLGETRLRVLKKVMAGHKPQKDIPLILLLFHNFLDAAAAKPDFNILNLQQLRNMLAFKKHITQIEEDFAHFRILALADLGINPKSLPLTPDEKKILWDIRVPQIFGSEKDQLCRVLQDKLDLTNHLAFLTDNLAKLELQKPDKFKRYVKFIKLLAQIASSSPGAEVAISSDMYKWFAPGFDQQAAGARAAADLSPLLDKIDDRATIADVRRELERTHWQSVFGIPLACLPHQEIMLQLTQVEVKAEGREQASSDVDQQDHATKDQTASVTYKGRPIAAGRKVGESFKNKPALSAILSQSAYPLFKRWLPWETKISRMTANWLGRPMVKQRPDKYFMDEMLQTPLQQRDEYALDELAYRLALFGDIKLTIKDSLESSKGPFEIKKNDEGKVSVISITRSFSLADLMPLMAWLMNEYKIKLPQTPAGRVFQDLLNRFYRKAPQWIQMPLDWRGTARLQADLQKLSQQLGGITLGNGWNKTNATLKRSDLKTFSTEIIEGLTRSSQHLLGEILLHQQIQAFIEDAASWTDPFLRHEQADTSGTKERKLSWTRRARHRLKTLEHTCHGDKVKLDQLHLRAGRALGRIIREHYPEYSKGNFKLSYMLGDSRANCVGYASAFTVLAGRLGLKAAMTSVEKAEQDFGPQDIGHAANLLTLPSGKMVTMDVTWSNYQSEPFTKDEIQVKKKDAFSETWKINAKDSKHSLIQVFWYLPTGIMDAYETWSDYEPEFNKKPEFMHHYYAKRLRRNPNDDFALLKLGDYYSLGYDAGLANNIDQAIDCYKKSLTLRLRASALARLGSICNYVGRDKAFKLFCEELLTQAAFVGDYLIIAKMSGIEESIVILKKALELFPGNPSLLQQLGRNYFSVIQTSQDNTVKRKYSALFIELAEHYLEKRPDDAWFWNRYEELSVDEEGFTDRYLTFLDHIIRDHPLEGAPVAAKMHILMMTDTAEGHRQAVALGKAFLLQKGLVKRSSVLSKLYNIYYRIKTNDDQSAKDNKGWALRRGNVYHGKIDELTDFLEDELLVADPTSFEARRLLAGIYQQQEHYILAILYLTYNLKAHPRDKETLLDLMECKAKVGKWSDVQNLAQRLLALDRFNALGLLWAARACLYLKNYEGALQKYEQLDNLPKYAKRELNTLHPEIEEEVRICQTALGQPIDTQTPGYIYNQLVEAFPYINPGFFVQKGLRQLLANPWLWEQGEGLQTEAHLGNGQFQDVARMLEKYNARVNVEVAGVPRASEQTKYSRAALNELSPPFLKGQSAKGTPWKVTWHMGTLEEAKAIQKDFDFSTARHFKDPRGMHFYGHQKNNGGWSLVVTNIKDSSDLNHLRFLFSQYDVKLAILFNHFHHAIFTSTLSSGLEEVIVANSSLPVSAYFPDQNGELKTVALKNRFERKGLSRIQQPSQAKTLGWQLKKRWLRNGTIFLGTAYIPHESLWQDMHLRRGDIIIPAFAHHIKYGMSKPIEKSLLELLCMQLDIQKISYRIIDLTAKKQTAAFERGDNEIIILLTRHGHLESPLQLKTTVIKNLKINHVDSVDTLWLPFLDRTDRSGGKGLFLLDDPRQPIQPNDRDPYVLQNTLLLENLILPSNKPVGASYFWFALHFHLAAWGRMMLSLFSPNVKKTNWNNPAERAQAWEKYQQHSWSLENNYIWLMITAALAIGTWLMAGETGNISTLARAWMDPSVFTWAKAVSLAGWLTLFTGSHYNKGTPPGHRSAAWKIFILITIAHLAPLGVVMPLSYGIHAWINHHPDLTIIDLSLDLEKDPAMTAIGSIAPRTHVWLNKLMKKHYFMKDPVFAASLGERNEGSSTVSQHYRLLVEEHTHLLGYLLNLLRGQYLHQFSVTICLPRQVLRWTEQPQGLSGHLKAWLAQWVIIASIGLSYRQRFTSPAQTRLWLAAGRLGLVRLSTYWQKLILSHLGGQDQLQNMAKQVRDGVFTAGYIPPGKEQHLLARSYQVVMKSINKNSSAKEIKLWLLMLSQLRLAGHATVVLVFEGERFKLPLPKSSAVQKVILRKLNHLEGVIILQPKQERRMWLRALSSSA